MDRAYKILIFIVALGAIVTLAFGAWTFCDTRWASAEQVELIAMRLDQKINQDRYFWMKQRFEEIKTNYPDPNQMPPATKKEFWDLECEINKVEGRDK